jgi:hypothetical protein
MGLGRGVAPPPPPPINTISQLIHVQMLNNDVYLCYFCHDKKIAVCAGMPRYSVFLTWCTGRLCTQPSSYISSMLRNHMAFLLITIQRFKTINKKEYP